MSTENPYAFGGNSPGGARHAQKPSLEAACAVPTGRILLAWLCFFLVATVGGFVIGAAFGAVLAAVMLSAGMDLQMIQVAAQVVGFVLGIPISMLSFWWAVNTFVVKQIRTQVSRAESALASPAPAPAIPAVTPVTDERV